MVLICCLAALGRTPQSSTLSPFPQAANPSAPNNLPPDTNASGQVASEASNSQKTTVRGCLSQSSDGNFMLSDNSGNSFQLRGETSQLNSYVGKEVRVDGIAMPSSGISAGSMASSTSTGSSATPFSIGDVHKIADTCPSGSNMK
jgi:hypothetical protein